MVYKRHKNCQSVLTYLQVWGELVRIFFRSLLGLWEALFWRWRSDYPKGDNCSICGPVSFFVRGSDLALGHVLVSFSIQGVLIYSFILFNGKCEVWLWCLADVGIFGWFCDIWLILWYLDDIGIFGWYCDFWLILWYLADIGIFGWYSEIWLKLWNLAEIVKFSQNCVIMMGYLGDIVKSGWYSDIWLIK